jgi:hypothetical protein
MTFLIQLDLFRTGALIKKSSGEIISYYIEYSEGFYICFIKKKKNNGKWTKARVVEKSLNQMFFDFSNNHIGIEIVS